LGSFFNKEYEAETQFRIIRNNYNSLKRDALQTRPNPPLVVAWVYLGWSGDYVVSKPAYKVTYVEVSCHATDQLWHYLKADLPADLLVWQKCFKRCTTCSACVAAIGATVCTLLLLLLQDAGGVMVSDDLLKANGFTTKDGLSWSLPQAYPEDWAAFLNQVCYICNRLLSMAQATAVLAVLENTPVCRYWQWQHRPSNLQPAPHKLRQTVTRLDEAEGSLSDGAAHGQLKMC
jgi:hypothetical protein